MIMGRILIALVGAVPVVYFVIVMGWGASVSKQIADFQSGKSTNLNISTPLTWFADAKEYRQLFDTDELNRRRSVSVEVETHIKDLLAEGETRPDPKFYNLYATARAPGVLIKECDLLLETLGLKCDVAEFGGRADETGKIKIEGRLVYVPAYEMGSPQGIENGEFASIYHPLGREDPLENSREGKLQALNQAMAQCAKLRETYGNCVIGRISLQKQRYGDKNELNAAATFEVYADQSQHNAETITASLRAQASQP